MALRKFNPSIILNLFFIFLNTQKSFSQSNFPQNIETFYPISTNNQPLLPPSLTPSPPLEVSSSSNNKTVVKAVAATAASTIVLCALFFFLLHMYTRRMREKKSVNSSGTNCVMPRKDFIRFNGNLKGVIVDEEGLDVLYWRNLEGDNIKSNFDRKDVDLNTYKNKKTQIHIQETPLLRGKSSTSQSQVWSQKEVEISTPPPQLPPLPPPVTPPPPPPLLSSKISRTPPLPTPPKVGAFASLSSSRPTPTPKSMGINNKAHKNCPNKNDGGSFRFDDHLTEALFGSMATNKKSPRKNNNVTSSPRNGKSGPPSQIFILDTRKSQNIAIILRSLAISRKEIINALIDGHGLDSNTLEKLTKISPTKEEEAEILAFNGDPTRLADGESFLYHLLKAVPSSFTRFHAMHFRSNYDSEILLIKETFQTLELACKELMAPGLFFKILEAVLKAGNRMNASTSRGNAQAFNLNALLKLSDVKSSDGKTTLLHFVVEEVIRSEGKRCVIKKNSSSSQNSNGNLDSTISSKDENENIHIKLGLPIVGGISAEFSNVKKASAIDYASFTKSCLALTDHVTKTRLILAQCKSNEQGRFMNNITQFLNMAEEEIKVVRDEQIRVMALVKRTAEYYQAGTNKETKLLQLFVVIKYFLGMVDIVCVNVARNLQKKKPLTVSGDSLLAKSANSRPSLKFPVLPANFLSEKSSSSDSDSEF